MANSSLLARILKFSQVGRITQNGIALLTSSGRRIHASSQWASQANETKQNIKESTSSAADHMIHKTKGVAGDVCEKAQDAADKAKKTAEDAWISTKDAAQRAKETVENRTEVSKEYVKENAEEVKKSMNSKQ